MSRLPIPRIKVCGVTRRVDLNSLAEAGVDSVGFNFVPSSPRCLDVARAADLCAHAAELALIRVAVVMNLEAAELSELLSRIDVDFVQLHGVERPEIADSCNGLPIIKATSWSGRAEEVELVRDWGAFAATRKSESTVRAWLIDAYAPSHGGGSGRVARWDLLQPRPAELSTLPLILAGGLRPDNVADAIAATGAAGVDTASGVESSPGVKDAALIRQFARVVNFR